VRSSFARASIATVDNSAGLIEIVPADTPRFDHHPITPAPKGLLLKKARTNVILQSNGFTICARSRSVSLTASDNFQFLENGSAFIFGGLGGSGLRVVQNMYTPFASIHSILYFVGEVRTILLK
jgi:hypothetical protein